MNTPLMTLVFTPGHETYDDYYRPEVRQIFVNAVKWAAPSK